MATPASIPASPPVTPLMKDARIGRRTSQWIDVLDVTEDLWRAKSSGPWLFLKQDTHWSPAGLQVVAQRIAEHLKPLLAPVDGLSMASRSEPVSHYGDLVRLPERQP